MNNTQKEKTKKAIATYCEVKGISRRQLAPRIGVSEATISNISNGKWDNIDDKLWRKVWNYVNPEHLNGLYETADYRSVVKMCNAAIKNKLMVGLIADTGMGKTTSLTAFATNRNVHYYYIDGTVSPRIFLKDMLRNMGVQFEGNLNAMLSRIADELNTQEDALLILDECAKLSYKMMLIIHSLRDKTRANCGIILAGMPDFKKHLLTFANKGTTGYAEFLRRINVWHELQGLRPAEVASIISGAGLPASDVKEYQHLKFGDLMNELQLLKQATE